MSNTDDLLADALARAPKGWWKEPNVSRLLCEHFRRHVLALGVVYRSAGSEERLALYTGFMLLHHDRLHWITAGHCIEELDRLRSQDSAEVLAARWYDCRPDTAPDGIPASLDDLVWQYGKDMKWDAGIVWLPANVVDLLRAAGDARWFTNGAWEGLADSNPEGFFIVGYPREWIEEATLENERARGLRFNAPLVGVPLVEDVDPTDHDRSVPFWSKEHCLYGRIALDGDRELESVKGLSGGPLISVEREGGRIRYRLWGVQSCASDLRPEIVRLERIDLLIHYLDQLEDKFNTRE